MAALPSRTRLNDAPNQMRRTTLPPPADAGSPARTLDRPSTMSENVAQPPALDLSAVEEEIRTLERKGSFSQMKKSMSKKIKVRGAQLKIDGGCRMLLLSLRGRCSPANLALPCPSPNTNTHALTALPPPQNLVTPRGSKPGSPQGDGSEQQQQGFAAPKSNLIKVPSLPKPAEPAVSCVCSCSQSSPRLACPAAAEPCWASRAVASASLRSAGCRRAANPGPALPSLPPRLAGARRRPRAPG